MLYMLKKNRKALYIAALCLASNQVHACDAPRLPKRISSSNSYPYKRFAIMPPNLTIEQGKSITLKSNENQVVKISPCSIEVLNRHTGDLIKRISADELVVPGAQDLFLRIIDVALNETSMAIITCATEYYFVKFTPEEHDMRRTNRWYETAYTLDGIKCYEPKFRSPEKTPIEIWR